MFALGGGQHIVVKLCREEWVDQGAECHAVAPTAREVLNVNILQMKESEGLHLIDVPRVTFDRRPTCFHFKVQMK